MGVPLIYCLLFFCFLPLVLGDVQIYNSSQHLSCDGCRKDLFAGQFVYCNGYYPQATKSDCEWVGGPGCTFAPQKSISTSECAALCQAEPGCFYYTSYPDIKVCNLHLMTQCSTSNTTAISSVFAESNQQNLGCYLESSPRDLPYFGGSSSSMTPSLCISLCRAKGQFYAGVQSANKCYCGQTYGRYGSKSAVCHSPCSGDSAQICGGTSANTVFLAYDWNYLGCWNDSTPRDLQGPTYDSDSMTPALCASYCSSYRYFGVQNGSQCFCGNSFGKYGIGKLCTAKCSGDASQICGGSWENSVYFNPPSNYLGCYADQSTRDLPYSVGPCSSNSPAICALACAQKGFSFAGVQYKQCYCGNSFGNYRRDVDAKCNIPCAGDPDFQCGGPWHNSVYLVKP